jgi:hypothetical protein
MEGLYYLVPQTSDMGTLTGQIASSKPIDSYQPIYVSVVLIILILSCSIIVFNKKDY